MNKPNGEKHPAISRLTALSESIRQYLKGEGQLTFRTTDTKASRTQLLRTRANPGSFTFVDDIARQLPATPDPRHQVAYEKAWDKALEIKQEFPEFELFPLPSCAVEPRAGLRHLSQWCIDSIHKITAEIQPANVTVGGEQEPEPDADANVNETDNKYPNEVLWDETDTDYEFNAKAVKSAYKVGQDYDIYELQHLDYSKLKKLLRRPGCSVRFMSFYRPGQRSHGKIHKKDWSSYLQFQIKQAKRIEDAVEEEMVNRLE